MDFAWQTLVETPQHILRAAIAPASASLLVTRPRALIADLASMLSMACARYAPQVVFGPTIQGADRIHTFTQLADERVEIGVVVREHRCVSYMLACNPDQIPDPTPLLDDMLARNR